MKLLGIFYFQGYSDPSAAILIDGKIIAFAEEERLVRNKHAQSYFPSRAINYVLKESNLKITDIDKITIGWDCVIHENGTLRKHFDIINKTYTPARHDIEIQQKRIKNLTASSYKANLIKTLHKIFGDVQLPQIEFVNHHLAHAVMGYFHSGFKKTLTLVIDGSGEISTTSWWIGENNQLTMLNEITIPHSLGWFYSAITEYLGYEAYDGEYKVMGLAAYGKDDLEISNKLNKMIWYNDKGGFETNPNLYSMGDRKFSNYFCDGMIKHIGVKPRSEKDEITQWHINLAYGAQKVLEDIVYNMTKYWVNKTGIKNLSIAGGVGLNVKMNGNLKSSGVVDNIFIHPLCSDTGISIGSAMTVEYNNKSLNPTKLNHVNFGPKYSDSQIKSIIKGCKVDFKHESDIAKKVAHLLSKGLIVGWFQGGMEAGPRALGNRSILADPRNIDSRDRVNEVVKFREFWRPFCPSMTDVGAKKYLKKQTDAPFMIITFDANDKAVKDIPAVVHIDNTCRVQIVGDENVCYKELLQEFGSITGIPVLLNTSFNIKGEPIVCTPHDAIRTFYATGLDALALGNYLLQKNM